MKLVIRRILLILTTLIIMISFIYLFKLKEEKTNKVPKSATLVFNYIKDDEMDE
mgnify:CR=1 FL=1